MKGKKIVKTALIGLIVLIDAAALAGLVWFGSLYFSNRRAAEKPAETPVVTEPEVMDKEPEPAPEPEKTPEPAPEPEHAPEPEPDPIAERAEELLRKAGFPAGAQLFAVSVRNSAGGEDFCRKLAAVCDAVSERFGLTPVFLALQSRVDGEASRAVTEKMKTEAYIVSGDYTASELMAVIAESEMVLSMRLHSLIFAARMAVPAAGIVYDPKVEAYLKLLGEPAAGTVTGFNEKLAEEIVSSVLKRREEYAAALAEKRDRLTALARENEKILK